MNHESASSIPEATYAHNLGKRFIPLLFEAGYKPDGWLGILQGAKPYYKFRSDDEIDESIDELLKAIKEDIVDHVDGKGHISFFVCLLLLVILSEDLPGTLKT